MNYVFLLPILAFFLLINSLKAEDFHETANGKQPDHLTPVNRFLVHYEQQLSSKLIQTGGSLGRLIIRPSFDPESSLSVYVQNQNQYYITVTQASHNIWYAMAENNDENVNKKVTITRTDREISSELALTIQRVWGKMLQNTRYPTHYSNGLDGTTYEFSVFVRSLGDLYGETWSPTNNLPAELVSIGQEIISFTLNKTEQEEPLIAKLRAFEKKIPKP